MSTRASPLHTQGEVSELQPPLPVRRLHNYLYCERLFYYQWVENLFVEDEHTAAGSHLHRNVDKPSAWDEEKQAALSEGIAQGTQLRSLKLHSDRLGIIGIVDLIEGGADGAQVVDYKKGSARKLWDGTRVAKEADEVQLMAHALLLEEQGLTITSGYIYYAEDRRRVPVELSTNLRANTLHAIQCAKQQAQSKHCPPPLINDPRCLHCSAYSICLPHESRWWAASYTEEKDDQQMSLVFADLPKLPQQNLLPSDENNPKVPPRPPGDSGEILIVQTPGAMIGQRGDSFIVNIEGQTVQKMPGHQLRAIYIYGAVQMSAQAVQTALELDIDISYFSPAGRFLGLLRGLPTSGIDARRGQYLNFNQPSICLLLAKEIIRTKIHNQRVLMMRNGDMPDSILKQMAKLRDSTAEARDLQHLMGLEGMAANLYFHHFGTMLKRNAEDWAFDSNSRNKRPPRDPVNAMLSLAYSMLAKELTGVCHSVGLDPFLGFLHQPRYGRPALALDLMEEFRPLIADSVVISLINRGEVTERDFTRSANGTALSETGRRAFWESYFRRMDTEVTHPHFSYKMSYRRMLEVQARQLWRYLRGEAVGYQGFTTR